MSIGKKIKKLRNAKMMTQSELAGGEITRNMLSRIENEAAQPSLDTVRYLAARLNVSPSYLLAEGTDEYMYIKHKEINDIKHAYLSGDFQICRDMCLNSSIPEDDEIRLILAESTLEIAIEAFNCGNLKAACELFDECIDACSQTIYETGLFVAKAGAYFRYMNKVSGSLSSETVDESAMFVLPAFSDSFCSYALKFCDESHSPASPERNREDVFAKHLYATELIEKSDFGDAYSVLKEIITSQEMIPEPMLYFVYSDYELCCKEIGDFKGAYEYSIARTELFQKLLS